MAASENKVICMDLLNYSRGFFRIPNMYEVEKVDFKEEVKNARIKVSEFVDAVVNSGYQLICFIDRSRLSEEAMQKWKTRRMKECREGVRRTPVGLAMILGTLFQDKGIFVHYSSSHDCDDTIAAFAYHRGGFVLSQDKDFFRYFVVEDTEGQSPPYKVYNNYKVKKRNEESYIMLFHHRGQIREKPEPRLILPFYPTTNPFPFILDENNGSWFYTGGNGSNITHLKNPYLQVRPLRQALYSKLGIEVVREEILLWDEALKDGVWSVEDVPADEKMENLLSDPKKAYEVIFGNTANVFNYPDILWKNHIFSQMVVVAEVCMQHKSETTKEKNIFKILRNI